MYYLLVLRSSRAVSGQRQPLSVPSQPKNLGATRVCALIVAQSTEVSHMTRASTYAVLQAAAKSLVWDLFAAAGYCRTKAFVDVEKFERELFSAARQWRATHSNLKGQRRKHGNTKQ